MGASKNVHSYIHLRPRRRCCTNRRLQVVCCHHNDCRRCSTNVAALDQTRFYLLSRQGPLLFVIKPEASKHVFKVWLGSSHHRCSCGGGGDSIQCIHSTLCWKKSSGSILPTLFRTGCSSLTRTLIQLFLESTASAPSKSS